MTSTEFSIGMGSSRNSSRVLKPPGGGHTSIFGDAEVKVINPRPKYDQQNSSNLNFCMNTTDPNILVEQTKHEMATKTESPKTESNASSPSTTSATAPAAAAVASVQQTAASQAAAPKRVPPGGHSSGGFW